MGQVFRRVVVAEGDALDRAGVCAIVRQHVGVSETFCVSSFSELTTALESAVDWCCVALDLSLPGLNGVHGITLLRQQHPSARLIVMSRQTDRATALAAIAAGAHGFVPKDMAVESMAGAFTLVIDGHVFLPDHVAELVGNDAALGESDVLNLETLLTARQQDVLQLLAKGRANKEIARDLGISESTVKVHLVAVFRLLGVRNRVGAARVLQGWMRANEAGPRSALTSSNAPHNRRESDRLSHAA
jgi:DNA-binding NarL/FixJ family response regulator